MRHQDVAAGCEHQTRAPGPRRVPTHADCFWYFVTRREIEFSLKEAECCDHRPDPRGPPSSIPALHPPSSPARALLTPPRLADAVIIATPFDLGRIIKMDKPVAVAKYAVEDREPPFLSHEVDAFVMRCLKNCKLGGAEAAANGEHEAAEP